MKTVREHLRDRVLRRAGLAPAPRLPDLPVLRRTEWSPRFERLMRNRLIVGAFRYGRMGTPAKGSYALVDSARRRLDAYEATGNLEHLVDVANLALVEFVEGRHPCRHWDAADDGEHCAPVTRSAAPAERRPPAP